MKTVFAVYCGDPWLSYSSLDLVGVCSTRNKAIKMVKDHAIRFDYGKITKDDLFCLKSHNQTQGRDYNYMICEGEMNKLGEF